jgi:hypothetical protein
MKTKTVALSTEIRDCFCFLFASEVFLIQNLFWKRDCKLGSSNIWGQQ